MHFLELVSRRHKRVNRSTCAAEINGLADSVEPAKVLALQYEDILSGVSTAALVAEKIRYGWMSIPIEVVVDAYSVYLAVTASDTRLPLEESLVVMLMTLKEQCSLGIIKKLWWCATEDMLSDALTKGAIKREPLLQALACGRWTLTKGTVQSKLQQNTTPERKDLTGVIPVPRAQ